MYSRIVLNTFILLKCIQLDDSPYLYLESQPDVICWESFEHKELLLGVLLSFLSIWDIAWPIYLFSRLYKKKKFINFLTQIQIFNFQKSITKLNVHDYYLQTQIRNSIFLIEDEILESEKIYKYLTRGLLLGNVFLSYKFFDNFSSLHNKPTRFGFPSCLTYNEF